MNNRFLVLVFLLLPLLFPAVAAADPTSGLMIYWEDSCDSLTEWGGKYQELWAVSPEYSVYDPILGSQNGIGHPWTMTKPSKLYREIPFPSSSSPIQVKYLDFWFKFESDPNAEASFFLNGVDITDTVEWLPSLHRGEWVHVQYPCSSLHGNLLFEVELVPVEGTSAVKISIDQIRLYADPIVPDFTATPTSGDVPLTVQFTDTTLWTEGTITGWLWEFGDGTTSNLQNPGHTYNYAARYDVTLTVQTKWGSTASTTKPGLITAGEVGPTPTIPPEELSINFTATPTEGDSPLTVTFVGEAPGLNITTWMWDFGDGYQGTGQTAEHTYNVFTLTSYDVTLYVIDDQHREGRITKPRLITVNGTGDTSGVGGTISSHQVRFVVQDYTGRPLEGIGVTATPLETTGPWGWLEQLLGIKPTVDIRGTVLNGSTGSDGGIVFMMIESIRYQVQFSDPAQGVDTSITIYPKEDEIVVTVWPESTPAVGQAVKYELFANPTGDLTTTLGLEYTDTLNKTGTITFTVRDENKSIIHQETAHGSNVTIEYPMMNDPGHTYYFGFTASHAYYGEIQQDRFITFKSDRPLVDLAPWIPKTIYNWVAIGILVILAAIPGYFTAKFGAVFLPLFAALFAYMGWLMTPWYLISGALALGVLIYIRWTEGDAGT